MSHSNKDEERLKVRASELTKATVIPGGLTVKKQRKPHTPLRQKLPWRLRRRYDIWIRLGLRQFVAYDLTNRGSFRTLAGIFRRKPKTSLQYMSSLERKAVYYTLWKKERLNISKLPYIGRD